MYLNSKTLEWLFVNGPHYFVGILYIDGCSLLFSQNELLGLPTRRLLKVDAIPIIFLITLRLYQRNLCQVLEGRLEQLSNTWDYYLWSILRNFCCPSRSSTVFYSQEIKEQQIFFTYWGCNKIFTTMYFCPSYTIQNMLFCIYFSAFSRCLHHNGKTAKRKIQTQF